MFEIFYRDEEDGSIYQEIYSEDNVEIVDGECSFGSRTIEVSNLFKINRI